MAHGLREAEIGPTGPRIDSTGRSGFGWYVRTSGGPFVASGADPLTLNGWRHCQQMDTSVTRRMRHKSGAIRCHTLPYVALHYM